MCNPIVTLINSVNAHSNININKPLVLYTDIISRTRRSPFTRGSSYLGWLPSERVRDCPIFCSWICQYQGVRNSGLMDYISINNGDLLHSRAFDRLKIDPDSDPEKDWMAHLCWDSHISWFHILNLLVAMLAPVAKLGIPRRIVWSSKFLSHKVKSSEYYDQQPWNQSIVRERVTSLK